VVAEFDLSGVEHFTLATTTASNLICSVVKGDRASRYSKLTTAVDYPECLAPAGAYGRKAIVPRKEAGRIPPLTEARGFLRQNL